jgi:hypothetical protein
MRHDKLFRRRQNNIGEVARYYATYFGCKLSDAMYAVQRTKF